MGDELSSEEKDAINSYLLKWFTALGFVNAVAIVAGLSYIFFIIPQEAASKANTLISEEINKQIAPMKEKAWEATSKALTEIGRVQEKVDMITDSAKKLTDDLKILQNKVSIFSEEKAIKVVNISDLLAKNPNVDGVFNLLNRVTDLEQRKPSWPDGHYCILKSGECPANFNGYRGALHAIWMLKSSNNYVTESKFGDSWILRHAPIGQNADNPGWHGEFSISTCCK